MTIDRYVLFGHPVNHSKSPLIHAQFAAQTGQTLDYQTQEAPLDGFAGALRAFVLGGGRGANVTAPFKVQAFEAADEVLERGRLAGAVNALKIDADGRVLADNFDGLGLVNDIQRNLGQQLAGKRVLLLGAGGAARGALLPFLSQAPAALVIANRDVAKGAALAQAFAGHGPVQSAAYADLQSETFDVVVNATSASLHGDLPPVMPTVFGRDALAYELVYGKGLTPFLRLAQNAGVRRIADGVGMLVEQAAEAFEWWRGVRPDTRAVIQQLTVPLV
jgi:shikimate dehydrogenase